MNVRTIGEAEVTNDYDVEICKLESVSSAYQGREKCRGRKRFRMLMSYLRDHERPLDVFPESGQLKASGQWQPREVALEPVENGRKFG